MAGLRDLNSRLDYYWNEYNRRFPGFFFRDENGKKKMPMIVPAQAIRTDPACPVYLRRIVDQDPTSMYMFINGNTMAGDVSRDAAVDFFYDFFHEKMQMPSSFEDDGYSPMEAASMEVLPAENDNLYKRYYDEQIEALRRQNAAEEKRARADKLGFDPDDPDIIDIPADGEDAAKPAGSAIQKGEKFAVGMPKNVFYAVDFHMPAGMELGYDGGRHDLGHRGGNFRRLREDEADVLSELKKLAGKCEKDSGLKIAIEDVIEKFGKLDETDKAGAEIPECDKCGDDACKAGEICGLKEEDDADPVDEQLDESIVNYWKFLGQE